jgi:hypothetical protein
MKLDGTSIPRLTHTPLGFDQSTSPDEVKRN